MIYYHISSVYDKYTTYFATAALSELLLAISPITLRFCIKICLKIIVNIEKDIDIYHLLRGVIPRNIKDRCIPFITLTTLHTFLVDIVAQPFFNASCFNVHLQILKALPNDFMLRHYHSYCNWRPDYKAGCCSRPCDEIYWTFKKKHGKKEVYKLQKFSHQNDSFIKSLSNKQKWKDVSHISCRGGTLLLLLVICIHNKQAMDVFWELETKVRMSMQKLQLGSIEESSSIYLFFVSLNEILIRLDGADEHCSM